MAGRHEGVRVTGRLPHFRIGDVLKGARHALLTVFGCRHASNASDETIASVLRPRQFFAADQDRTGSSESATSRQISEDHQKLVR